MIGISFRVKNEYGNPLKQIFENIRITEYFWKVIWSEVYRCTDTGLGSNLFDKDIMTSKEFQNDMSDEQILSLTELIQSLQRRYGIPSYKVLFHRDVPHNATVCPGDNFPPFTRLP